MSTRMKTAESHVKLAMPELPAGVRSGGEKHPLEYPHLYQIQAGDWRISYAVEHNRLAILVLEVLNPPGGSPKDADRESLNRKMKIKLLDWPEGVGNKQLPPEVVSNKMKIKWLDLAEEVEPGRVEAAGKSRIKLKGPGEKKAEAPRSNEARKITLLQPEDIIPAGEASEPEAEQPEGDVIDADDRKITPVDEPSM